MIQELEAVNVFRIGPDLWYTIIVFAEPLSSSYLWCETSNLDLLLQAAQLTRTLCHTLLMIIIIVALLTVSQSSEVCESGSVQGFLRLASKHCVQCGMFIYRFWHLAL